MRAEEFTAALGADFYAGVPDSQLKALCDYLMERYKTDPKHHVIAANEGNCAALAAGYFLATGKTPVVYLQNSGIGNIVNPVASLLHEKVYAVPMIFVVGWRGEPGVYDEPQHIYQGEVTLQLLEDMGMATFVLHQSTTKEELAAAMERFRPLLAAGGQAAIVVRKGSLTGGRPVAYQNDAVIVREEAIRRIAAAAGTDPVVSTTGKASRELFELREANGQGHQFDFLTVGSMGHASSIALGIALQRPEKQVWCIDGDGAALMHMGAMAVIGAAHPANLIHIILNNGAHETVGGMPTAAQTIDLPAIARACGYESAVRVDTLCGLDAALAAVKGGKCPALLEIRCAIASRKDLGRPTVSPQKNKQAFMGMLRNMGENESEAGCSGSFGCGE
ncbi:MAG: phosphonopyruvate decarboxylase [Oscillospiraceae bacterium]|nr:phosphonopyruvate decarboxylase [Oscillospiraceae bacterium]